MVGIGVGEALRKNKGMYPSSYFKMETILQEFIQIIDHIDWSSLITLRRCSELLRIKIELLEDSIPDYIDDDWWNQPQHILLSYKLRRLRSIRSKVLKCIEDVETDNLQHAQNPDEDQVTDYVSDTDSS
jgi:hypothetical protein